MDLNQKYSDHQGAVMRASAAVSARLRARHLETAARIAQEIGHYQARLGAAAACAWSAGKLGSSPGQPFNTASLSE